MGNKKKSVSAAAPAKSEEDALLDAAIAANDKARQDALEQEARRAAIAEEVKGQKQESMRNGLTREQIVERLNVVPAFSVMSVTPTGKYHQSLTFKDSEKDKGFKCCPFFVDPAECKDALRQTQEQQPEKELGLGVVPLGKAFALAVGWTTSNSTVPFALRAAPSTAEKLRPHLVEQLEQHGLPTNNWTFSVFMCEDLQTPTDIPVFLSREQLAVAWTKSGRPGMPMGTLIATDLRIIVDKLQQSHAESGCDWSHVRFVGSDEGWQALHQAAAHADAKGGEMGADVMGVVGGQNGASSSSKGGKGKGKGKGRGKTQQAEEAAAAEKEQAAQSDDQPVDPETEPPALV